MASANLQFEELMDQRQEHSDCLAATPLATGRNQAIVSLVETISITNETNPNLMSFSNSHITSNSNDLRPANAPVVVTNMNCSTADTSVNCDAQRCECTLLNWLSVQNDKKKERTIRDGILAYFSENGVPIRDICDAQTISRSSANSTDYRKSETWKTAFGSPLSALRGEFIDEIGFVPHLLTTMCNIVRANIKTEYLFRKSGLHALHKKLRDRIDKAYSGASVVNNNNDSWLLQSVDDTHRVTVHDVTYLLKAFFGELREPLLTSNFEPHFLKCIEHFRGRAQRARAVLFLCWLLPHDHLATLMYFARLLAEVAAQSDSNRMNAHSLATICAPKLIRLSDDPESSSIRDQRILNLKIGVVETLIENAGQIGHVPLCLLTVNLNQPRTPASASTTPNTSLTHRKRGAHNTRSRASASTHSVQLSEATDDETTTQSAGKSKKRRSKSVHGGFLAFASALKLRKQRPSNDSSTRSRREPRRDSTSVDSAAHSTLDSDMQAQVSCTWRNTKDCRVAESTAVFDCSSNLHLDTNVSCSTQATQIRVGKTCVPVPLVRKRKSETRLGESDTSKIGAEVLSLALTATESSEYDANAECDVNASRGSAMSTFKRRVFQQALGSLRRDRSKPTVAGLTESNSHAQKSHLIRARQLFERELENLSPIPLSPHRTVTRHLSALAGAAHLQVQNQTPCRLSPGGSGRTRSLPRGVKQQSLMEDQTSDLVFGTPRNAAVSRLPSITATSEMSEISAEPPSRCAGDSCLSTPLQCAGEDTSTLNASTGSRKLRRGQPNAVHNGLVHPPTRLSSARRADSSRVRERNDDEKENARELRHSNSTVCANVASNEECATSAKLTIQSDNQSPITGRNACPPKVKDTVLRFEELTARHLRSVSGINVSNGSACTRLGAYRVTPLYVNSSLASTETSI